MILIVNNGTYIVICDTWKLLDKHIAMLIAVECRLE